MESKGKGGLLWLAAPLVICLPCLLPFIAAGVLTGIGVGAVGSFLSDNAILTAGAACVAVLVTLPIGQGVSRLRQLRGTVRLLSRDG